VAAYNFPVSSPSSNLCAVSARRAVICALCSAWLCAAGGAAHAAAGTPAADDAAAAGGASEASFQLNELRVLGNTSLPALKIATLLYPYLGPGKSLQDVEAARVTLEGEYHAAGFGTVFVDIPEQTVGDDGVVRLRVTESRLRQARITGTRYFSNRQIRDALPAVAAASVPNLPAVQAEVNAINAITADRVVVPVLKAGATPGSVDLELKVQDRLPLHAVVELNNQYTADTARLRSSLALSYDNAFGRQDSLALQFQTAPQDREQVKVFAASYLRRIGDSGDKLSLSFINSSSNVATLSDISVAGKGKTYGLRWLHPVPGGAAARSSLAVGVDYKASAQDVRLSAADSLSTPLSYASLQLSYSWQLDQQRRDWSWNNALVLGLPALGSSRQEFADKCFGCKPAFAVLRSEAAFSTALPWQLRGAVRIAGQYAAEPLISNEQLLLGGAHSVRGYLEAEELGDSGARVALELHLDKPLPEGWPLLLQPFVFFDAGIVSFQRPLPGQDRTAQLRSVGLGIDWVAWRKLGGALTLAQPRLDATRTRRGSRRVEFVVRGTF
jgi:hemolysin activation/secretion protein